jgi:hypothetical protein
MKKRGRPRKTKPEPAEPIALRDLIERVLRGEYIPPPRTGKRGRPRTREEDARKISHRFHQLVSDGETPAKAHRQVAQEFRKRLRGDFDERLSVDYVRRQVKYWDRIVERHFDIGRPYELKRVQLDEEQQETQLRLYQTIFDRFYSARF